MVFLIRKCSYAATSAWRVHRPLLLAHNAARLPHCRRRVQPVTGHFGHRTLRTRTRHFGTSAEVSQDTSAPKTRFETLRHWCRSVLKHFGTKSTKSRDTSAPGQMRRDTSAPLPKYPKTLRHQSLRHIGTGAEMSRTLGHQIQERRNLASSKCRNSAET